VESQNYNPCVSSIVYQLVFAPTHGRQGDETVVEQQLEKLEKIKDIYEAHLSKNKYLADLSHNPYTYYLVNVAKKGDGITSRKHVSASLNISLKMLLKVSWKTVTAKMNAKAGIRSLWRWRTQRRMNRFWAFWQIVNFQSWRYTPFVFAIRDCASSSYTLPFFARH